MAGKWGADAGLLLAWWQLDVVTDEQVVGWADQAISQAKEETPVWLFDLSTMGPKEYLKARDVDDPGADELTFESTFGVMVEKTSLDDHEAISHFQSWVMQAAMGEDFEIPGVREAYTIDHLYNDCGLEEEAYQKTLQLLRVHKPMCHSVRDMLSGL